MEEVRRRVVAHDLPAAVDVDLEMAMVAHAQLALLNIDQMEDNLPWAFLHIENSGFATRPDDPASVGDLPPGLSIERRLLEN